MAQNPYKEVSKVAKNSVFLKHNFNLVRLSDLEWGKWCESATSDLLICYQFFFNFNFFRFVFRTPHFNCSLQKTRNRIYPAFLSSLFASNNFYNPIKYPERWYCVTKNLLTTLYYNKTKNKKNFTPPTEKLLAENNNVVATGNRCHQ